MTEKRFRLDTGCIIDQDENMVLSDEQVRNLLNKFHEELQSYEVEEKTCCEEVDPKMVIVFETQKSYHKHSLFRRIQEEVTISKDMYLYVFFNMGSIILNIDDPKNHIYFNEDYSEIYNEDKKEYTFIKNDEIKGFILDFKTNNDIEGEEE